MASTHNSSERIICARPLTYYQVWSFPPSCRRVAARDMCFFPLSLPHRPGDDNYSLLIYALCGSETARTSEGFGVSNITKICICVNVVINSKSIDAVWRRRAVHARSGDFARIRFGYFVAFSYFHSVPRRCWSGRAQVNGHSLEIKSR